MKTYASFYDIVDGVSQETGHTNLVNRYQEIRKLIVRAERDINPYAGHFIKKKVKYKKGSGAFNGKFIKKPDDFIELLDIYNGTEKGSSTYEVLDNPTHFILCDGVDNSTALVVYFATQLDPEGNPFVPYNHYEAVVAFIVWKLYSQRTFQGKGNANLKIDFKNNYEQFCKAARGFDFFPSEEAMQNMSAQKHLPTYVEINCDSECFCACGIEEDTTPSDMEIYYWQENSLKQEIFLNDVTDQFLLDKDKISQSAFEAGIYFTAGYAGRYGLAIKNGPKTPDKIIDALGSTITNSVEFFYDEIRNMLIIISKNYISPGTFYLKLLQ